MPKLFEKMLRRAEHYEQEAQALLEKAKSLRFAAGEMNLHATAEAQATINDKLAAASQLRKKIGRPSRNDHEKRTWDKTALHKRRAATAKLLKRADNYIGAFPAALLGVQTGSLLRYGYIKQEGADDSGRKLYVRTNKVFEP